MQNYFELYININKIKAVICYGHSWRSACCNTNKIPKIFNFTDPEFFKFTKTSGVAQVIVNFKPLFKNGLALLPVGIKKEHIIKSTVKNNKQYLKKK